MSESFTSAYENWSKQTTFESWVHSPDTSPSSVKSRKGYKQAKITHFKMSVDSIPEISLINTKKVTFNEKINEVLVESYKSFNLHEEQCIETQDPIRVYKKDFCSGCQCQIF